jgi:LPS sulfotransferase NodH
MPPFIVLSLPRSRSYWLSKFLAYGGWTCGHEEIRHLRSLADLASWWSIPMNGSCETAGAPWWRLIPNEVRIVTVRRPVYEVHGSLMAKGQFEPQTLGRQLVYLDRKLDQVQARRSCLTLAYQELNWDQACAEMFEYCLGMEMPLAWWQALAPLNWQIDLPGLLRHFVAHRPQLDQMTKIARQEVLRGLRPRRSFRDFGLDGIEIKEVSLQELLTDCTNLMAEHCEAVGEPSDNFWNKNWPLARQLEALGLHQIMLARCNGRPMGYLMTVLSPSLEDKAKWIGIHHGFVASKDGPPGLGRRLQVAANEALRRKGVDEAILTAATRGDGPRLGPVYERMGAKMFGTTYRLALREQSWA